LCREPHTRVKPTSLGIFEAIPAFDQFAEIEAARPRADRSARRTRRDRIRSATSPEETAPLTSQIPPRETPLAVRSTPNGPSGISDNLEASELHPASMRRAEGDLGSRGVAGVSRALGAALALALASSALADSTPSLWDPGLHLERPDISGLRAIRFLTADDYPPLDFARADGSLSGFNVEIARAICEELLIGCTIQARPWDALVDSLETGKGDAVIASMTATAALRERIDFTEPYYLTPARFAARKAYPEGDITPTNLRGKRVGAITGSAHEAFLATFFGGVALKPYPDFAALHEALRGGEIDLAFADGLTLAIWLAGEHSADCCAFRGGPFLESRYFGEGVGIAVRKEDADLRRAMDWALARLAARGVYGEIYHKYFEIGFF
jgi:polar amino acid transport system substrate-binding protein